MLIVLHVAKTLFLLNTPCLREAIIGQSVFLDFLFVLLCLLSKPDTNCHCLLEHMVTTDSASVPELQKKVSV